MDYQTERSGVLSELSLFSGYGGFSLGLRLAGLAVRTIGYVEINPFCQQLLRARIRDGFLDWAPIIKDIRSADFRPMAGLVDVLSSGFPCQPHSQAGKRRGSADDRNLWPDTLNVITQVRPKWVLLENVRGLLSSTADGDMESGESELGDVTTGTPGYAATIVGQLADAGYDCEWGIVSAADVGAPHQRERWWCIGVADSDSNRARERHNSHAERGYPGEIPEGRDSQGTQDEGTHIDISSATGGGDLVNTESEWPGGVRDEGDEEGTRHRYVVPGVSGRVHNGELGDSTGSGLEGVGANSHQEGWQESHGQVGLSSRTIPIWPPSPSDAHAWERVIRERPDLAPALTKEAQPSIRGMVNGSADRLDRPSANDRVNRLKALGNGIVPQSLAEFLRRVLVWEA